MAPALLLTMNFTTPRDRFRGALIGSLLGPLYCFQLDYLQSEPPQPRQLQDSQVERSPDYPSPFTPPSLGPSQLTPEAEGWLRLAWQELELAGKLVKRPLGVRPDSAELSGTSRREGSGNREGVALQYLRALPETLVRSPWLSGRSSLAEHLQTAHASSTVTPQQPSLPSQQTSASQSDLPQQLAANRPASNRRTEPSSQPELSAIWTTAEPYLERSSQFGELLLKEWLLVSALNSDHESADVDLTHWQRRLGGQLIALNWGAAQGARRLPWTAKAWLGSYYGQILRLGDRLHDAWAGRADFEKLGVSCEGSSILTTLTT